MYQWHVEHGSPAFAYLGQASGYFRRLDQDARQGAFGNARVRLLFDHQENRNRFQRLRYLQEKYGFSVGQIVIGYLINQPFPVFALVGPKTLADLKDNSLVRTPSSRKTIFTISNTETLSS